MLRCLDWVLKVGKVPGPIGPGWEEPGVEALRAGPVIKAGVSG